MSAQGGSFPRSGQPILTLEPLVEAVRTAIEARSWSLSGVQKTTSYEYEGRWAGETTRSAYLFFHPHEGLPAVVEADSVSLDVFLDETRKGMTGNLALVIEGPDLAALGTVARGLEVLARVARETVPRELDSPLSGRASLKDPGRPVESSQCVFRVKVQIPRTAIEAGERAVAAVVRSALDAYEETLAHPALQMLGSP